jgi:biopolymer transport protein ExbB
MYRWPFPCLLLLAALAAPATFAFAQDAAEPPAAAQEPEGAGAATAEEPSVGMLILSSNAIGLVFYGVLAIFSLAALTIVIERLVNLTRSKVVPPDFVQSLRELLARENDSADAFLRLSERSNSPIGNILKAGALRAGRPVPEVEKAMEDAAAHAVAALRARHRGLSIVGNIAPLVGLLGTVVGMIFAFGEASDMGLGKGETLAHGIYLALMTTAMGLAIAIPSLLCAAWFNGRVERYIWAIDQELQAVYPSFVRMERESSVVSSL